MRFASPQYTGEQLAFDGSKVLTGHLPSGRRSPLSLYLEQQSLPLREGLLGGSLSTGWVLLRLDKLKPRLDYKGLKKVDGRKLHEVSDFDWNVVLDQVLHNQALDEQIFSK